MALVEQEHDKTMFTFEGSGGGVITSGGASIENRSGVDSGVKSISFDPKLSPETQPETDEPAAGAAEKTAQLSRRGLYGTVAVVVILLMLLMRDQ